MIFDFLGKDKQALHKNAVGNKELLSSIGSINSYFSSGQIMKY